MKALKVLAPLVAQIGVAWAVVTLVVGPAMRGEPMPWSSPAPEPDEISRELGPLLPMESILVNVADTKGRRFFKASLSLEIDGKELEKTAPERLPVLRGAVIDLLSSKTLEELVEPSARDSLRGEILQALNANVSGGQFRDLYFTEFLVQ